MSATECRKCGNPRERKIYAKGRRAGKSYWYCGHCAVHRTRQWREDNPERLAQHRAQHLINQRQRHRDDPRWAKNKQLMKHYRMTLEQFEEMLAEQGGVCAGCGADEPGGHGTWHVDHNHDCCPGRTSCGECIRALLCAKCNQALGLLNDDPDILRALADYLESHQTIGASR